MWDETSERLRASSSDEVPDADANQRASTAHVMQVKMAVVWGWAGATPAEWLSCRFEVVSVPMVVKTPSAENLWAAFTRNSNINPLLQFRNILMSAASFAIEFKECDGASGNDKLIARWVKVLGESNSKGWSTVVGLVSDKCAGLRGTSTTCVVISCARPMSRHVLHIFHIERCFLYVSLRGVVF